MRKPPGSKFRMINKDSMPKVSIVIRCFNEEKHIARLLTGIQQQTVKDIEIILVDSGSTDATISIATNFPIKLVRIKPEEFSFGYALNKGCSKAEGEILVFASAHVYPVYDNWIECLVEPLISENTAICYGKQRGNHLTRYSEHQIFAKWFPDESNNNQLTPFCNNANSAIRYETWKKFKFDEELTGLEDLEWAKRQIEGNKSVAYNAEAEVIHVHEETAFKIYNRYMREAIALHRIMPDTHITITDSIKLFLSNVIADIYHAYHDQVLIHNMYDIFVFRVMQFAGTYFGFRQKGKITNSMKRAFYYPRSRIRNKEDGTKVSNKIDYSCRE